jgi:amino acid adenylation domain-containing protein
MSEFCKIPVELPPEQQVIRAQCFHPTGSFLEFKEEEVEQTIPQRFEKIVRQYPNRIAFKATHQGSTYLELNAMANRLAWALLARQGKKTELIALLLEKDVAQIAAMLGVMKAGKFFLILDPTFPNVRLASMLADSRAKLLVTNRQNASLAGEVLTRGCELLEWDPADGAHSADNPDLADSPKALAFINYTSGSTGEPKGLLRTHRMILHNIMLRTNLVHVCRHDRISLLSSGTSNAITNAFLALLNGAALCSLELKKENAARLARWLTGERVTICPLSSPLFRSLCKILTPVDSFPDLRVVRLRSEAVYQADAELYRTFFPRTCVFVTGLSSNETGPLRDFLIDHETEVTGGVIPVGYAVPGKEILLVDDAGNEVGLNEIGEIAVSSRYISPGYLRRPQLTRAKFKRDPKDSGKRLYLTGDMGQLLSDGCLLYQGRKDFRVKIRGYGVDLKEVETALRAHPTVVDAVVTTHQDASGESKLVAYLIYSPPPGPTVGVLRTFLAPKLADYMIPSTFVALDRMPLTPHGKVDRHALPAPDISRPYLGTSFIEPVSWFEKRLAEIWAEVLGVHPIGLHDNFFDLGGHSLIATRILARVSDTFRIELAPHELFEAPTVASLAAAIQHSLDQELKPVRLGAFSASSVTRPKTESVLPIRDESPRPTPQLLRAQQGLIRAKCFHPSGTYVEFPKEALEQSIPDRFEKIVHDYPDRVAVKTFDDALTYSELNAMANGLAKSILARGGSKTEAVALVLGNRAWSIAAMLGVLKAGRFAVLLNPAMPKARIAATIKDSQATFIVADLQDGALAQELAAANGSRLIEFESIDWNVRAEDPNLTILPAAPGFLFYTSGSTGEPKGVLRYHRSLLHQAMIFTNLLQTCREDRISLFSSGTANSVSNAFLALLNGATLLPFHVQQNGMTHIAKWLSDERITLAWMGSPLFRNVCASLRESLLFPELRVLKLASETVYPDDIEAYKKHFSSTCVLVTGLSASEAGVLSLCFIDHDTELPGGEVPVGYAVQDKEIFLLDPSGNELGFNQLGEIVVRSGFLSPGYWNRPALTKAKFKNDPRGSGKNIYFTGDMGVMLPDGCLLHKGRKDFRVKIRGYGVETGEVEKALLRHPEVREAVVVEKSHDSGETSLIAYYTLRHDCEPNVNELRAFLGESLPDYMIPAAFTVMHSIPLTRNGKVDRRALPTRENNRPKLATPYVAPTTDVQKELAQIWAEILAIESIGIHDSFFDLGGHSLSAARLLARILNQFHVEMSLSNFFNKPSLAALAEEIEWARKSSRQANIQPQRGNPSDGGRPLALAQLRLWFLDQLEPGGIAYNLTSAAKLTGRLDIAALERGFNEVIRRHESLRTIFRAQDGIPQQIVLPALTINILILDMRRIVSDSEQDSEVRRLITEEAQRPFDLATGPLLRVTLLRLDEKEHVLVWAIHHIVFDGWSKGILARELSILYAAFLNAKPSPLQKLPVQYRDVALWQGEWLQKTGLQRPLTYWKKQLEDLPALELSGDRPSPTAITHRGARRCFVIAEAVTRGLKSLSQRHGVTLFMTLVAAFQILLHRHSGQTDIVIGTPVAGRNRTEFETLIGFFLNMLVLRTDLSGNPTFRDLLTRVRKICLGALNHQELPFERLVQELHPERDLSRNPLFRVTFAFQNTPKRPMRFGTLIVSELEVETGIARFDLHLFLQEEGNLLRGHMDYSTDLFDGETVARLINHFQNLLEGIVSNPEQRISDLTLLSSSEQHQLLFEWNDTCRGYSNEKCVHQLFEEQVEKTPDAIAVIFEDEQLTYRELNQQANRVAHYLRRLGVGPETLVGLCMERSLEMVVGLLGILKAGAAYVPLDPCYPSERLASMLEDARVAALLIQQRLAVEFPQHGARVVYMDGDLPELAQQSDENLNSEVTADNLAYVIYTSGSTGKPKAAMIPQGAIANHMLWMQEIFPLKETDRVLQKTSFGFDAAVWEFYAPLLAGATLVMAPSHEHNDITSWVKLVAEQHITVLQLVPSVLRVLLDEELGSWRTLRRLYCGGESLPIELAERISAFLPGVELYNLYGPTETTIDALCGVWTCDQERHVVPIGHPINNVQVYLLDPYLKSVAVGVTGELYVGGAGLGRGYLNEPELTAERFIPNPFSDRPGARLYRTGDLARYLPDGNIEFVARIDDQVKIRGFRIELGEIEAVLQQHGGVREAVVLAWEETLGDPAVSLRTDKRLVAYVVSGKEQACTSSQLQHFLKQKLPEYMVPSAFVFLDAMPLRPNGKVDRKALLVLDHDRPESEQSYVAPRTAVEESLAEIWAQVLKVARVGIHDSFFDLGGHSLLATQVMSRVREELRVELPLRAFFEAPTIAELSSTIEQIESEPELEEIARNLADVESLAEEDIERQLADENG